MHIADPFRIKIAVHYAQHELRKLFPGVRDAAAWQSLDAEIAEWPKKLLPRDFWNGVHGISMGFRLKSIVPWLTSLNMHWAEKELPLAELWFGGRFDLLASLDIPESAATLREWLSLPENKELLEKTRKNMAEKAAETAPRDDFPLFVVKKDGDKLRVIDGNRRLLQAIANEKNTLPAVVGEPIGQPALYEHWVPTSLLVDLIFWHKRQIENGRDNTKTAARLIAELIRDSSAGRYEFVNRAVHRDDEIHLRLRKAVEEITPL